MIVLGEVLKSYRVARKLSLRGMADEVGIDYQILGNLETSHTKDVRGDTLVKLWTWMLGERVQIDTQV